MRERVDMCPSLFTVSPLKLLFYICMFSTLYKAKQKYVCFQSHAKKYFGSVGLKWFVFNFSFYNWIDVGWHLECISACTLHEKHLAFTFQNNDYYIGRQK